MALIFNEEKHEYIYDGVKIPSVTQAMSVLEPTTFYRDGGAGAEFGTIGHQIVALMMDEALGEYDPEFEPWMVGIRKFFNDEKPRPVFLERKMAIVGAFPFAGTLDFSGNIARFKNDIVILDWKFWSQQSKKLVALAGVQTAGYEMLYRDYCRYTGRMRRGCVHFYPGGYHIHIYTNAIDRIIFQSALNCWWFRERNL